MNAMKSSEQKAVYIQQWHKNIWLNCLQFYLIKQFELTLIMQLFCVWVQLALYDCDSETSSFYNNEQDPHKSHDRMNGDELLVVFELHIRTHTYAYL